MLDLHLDEDAVKQLVLTVPTPMFIKDERSRFVVCNQAFANYAERDQGEMVGLCDADMPWADLGGAGYRDWDRRVMKTGEPVLQIAEDIMTAARDVRSIETNKFPVRDSHGSVIGVLGYFNERGPSIVGPQPPAQWQSPFVIEDVVLRYLGGEPISAIAETTGLPPSAVYRALRDQGCVAKWQQSPPHWSRYPVFLAALRSCRLDLIRDEFRLDKYSVLNDASAAELALVRRQIAALNEAIADSNLRRVHGVLSRHLQHRTHELRALLLLEISRDESVDNPDWARRYDPSRLQLRYAAELERIESDRSIIDRELLGSS